jgi:8-oxo-dGTP diphosphatase
MSKCIVQAGVAAIVRKGDHVLVGKREGSHGAGLYAFPGGSFEPKDKSIEFCTEREVFEETGMICKSISPDGHRSELFTTFDILSEDGSAIWVTVYVLADYIIGGTPDHDGPNCKLYLGHEPNKCKKWQFVTLQELYNLVREEQGKGWIPLAKICHYLKGLK